MRKAKPLPRYVEIYRRLEDAIVSGAWSPGHRVPSEHELAEKYGCARMTVNKALSALASAGLIVRRRRSGSFVAAPTSQRSVLEIQDIQAEVIRSGRNYRFELLSRAERSATKIDAARLGVTAGRTILALKGVHFADRRPIVVEDRLINLATVPTARKVDFGANPPGSWLLAQVPWSEAEHRIRAVGAERKTASLLKIRPGTACLMVERKTWQGGRPVTAVTLTYPGDRHELVARFSPSQGNGTMSGGTTVFEHRQAEVIDA